MNSTLIFHHALLARGQHMLQLGCCVEARPIFTKLTAMNDLDTAVRLAALRGLVFIETKLGEFRAARQHLRQAMRLAPNMAELYEQFALNIEQDETAPLEAGMKAIRRAVRLVPQQPRFRAVLGRLALALGQRTRAINTFRRLVRMMPLQHDVIRTTLRGLIQLKLHEEAYQFLMQMRAETDDHTALDRLWHEVQYEITHVKQASEDEEDAVILPFVMPNRSDTADDNRPLQIYRVDSSSPQPKPHILRRATSQR